MIPIEQEVFNLWVSLTEDCRTGIDRKDFRNRQDKINYLYKKMNYQQQGSFHMMIHESLPAWVAANP